MKIKTLLLPTLLISTCCTSLAFADDSSGTFNSAEFMKQQASIIANEQSTFDKIATGGALTNLKYCLKNDFNKPGCEISNMNSSPANSAPQPNNSVESSTPANTEKTSAPDYYYHSAPKAAQPEKPSDLPINNGSDNSNSWNYKL